MFRRRGFVEDRVVGGGGRGQGRSSSGRAAGATLCAALFCLALAVAACDKGEGGSPTATSVGRPAVMTVEQALTAGPGREVFVEGFLFFEQERAVLASSVMESYPPLPGGPTIAVKKLEAERLVGLSSTPKGSNLAQASWSDYPVVLQGAVEDGVLEVTAAPQVVEGTLDGLVVRFSPVSEPLRSNEPVWWVFDVLNTLEKPAVLTFSSGQRADVTLAMLETQAYRWSSGRAFTQAIETVTVEPGGSVSVILEDTLAINPGEYDLEAWVTASVPTSKDAVSLPVLSTTVTVY